MTGFELSARREITAVLTDAGPIATEIVVNAAGMWAPQVAAMVGAFIPSTPVDHQHIALKAVPGPSCRARCPASATRTTSSTARASRAGWSSAGTSSTRVSRWEDGVPWEHAAQSLPPDWERFAPLMAGAIRRFPFLADAEAIRLVCHPDAMTPDANPLLGPLPGVRGFWVAAGLSLNGFGGGGGIGRAMAGWITAGDPGVDIGPYRAWRFGDTYRDPGFAAGLARETYSDYYRLRYPFDADLAGRPRRLSALHGRLQEAGAVFGTKAGWERADYHEPGRPWRRAGRDQAGYGWTRPPWFERVCAEARAVRERAGIIDLSSFGKIAVEGPGALGLLQRVSANDIDRPVGSVVYTQWCDERGGMVADVTVTRLADDRFRVVTGAGYLASEMAWLRTHREDDDGPSRSATSAATSRRSGCGGRGHGTSWSPRAPADEVGDDAIPMRRARTIHIGPAPVHAARISYAGELGWELTMPRRMGRRASGIASAPPAPRRARAIGYRALDALRMEKGYRYYGTDLTMLDTPFEAGLGRLRPARRRARSSGATRSSRPHAQPDRTAASRTLVIGGADYEPVYGGEAVRLDGDGRRSPPQRRLRPDRRADDRLRLPAGGDRRGHRPRDRRLRSARRGRHRPRCHRRSALASGCAASVPLLVARLLPVDDLRRLVSTNRNHRRVDRRPPETLRMGDRHDLSQL